MKQDIGNHHMINRVLHVILYQIVIIVTILQDVYHVQVVIKDNGIIVVVMEPIFVLKFRKIEITTSFWSEQ